VYARFFAAETGAEAGSLAIDGLVARRFTAGSPYEDETLYFEPGSVHPFVARCFPRAAGDTRQLCLTELKLGRRLIAAVRVRPA
ncbi:hypothetical protein J8J27_32090, partial [Mycobacterium tuberculosis]|nr:hypothetical protein [Mycobacterium tuberculosis]